MVLYIEIESKLSMCTIPINNTKYDIKSKSYYCDFKVNKLHQDFILDVVTMDGTDFMGFNKVLYYITCDNNSDNCYPASKY